jgi:hypothetical protein
LAIVNAHVLRNKGSSRNVQLQEFCENISEGLVCDVEKKIIEQPRATPTGKQENVLCWQGSSHTFHCEGLIAKDM